jgi:peptidoglycan/LPS O-acetylase OafA/YrhL
VGSHPVRGGRDDVTASAPAPGAATPAAPLGRLAIIDLLRGLAASLVCWFHFTNGNGAFPSSRWLKASGAWGWLGVEVFFVISGFILPYSMARRGYRLRDAGRFVVKRVVRLDPPYLAAVVLMIAAWYASALMPGYRGTAPAIGWGQALAHVGYLNGVLGLPWLNPVFWSLAIEFQFYLLIAAVFPLVAHPSSRVRLAATVSFGAAALAGRDTTFVVHYCALFACGVACFQFEEGRVGWPGFLALLGLMGAVTARTLGAPIAVVTIVTALVIASRFHAFGWGGWLGSISYSLYLVHVPVGGRIVNLGERVAHTMAAEIVVLAAACLASIAAALVLYRFVERPAQRWSSAIRYRA